MGWELLKRFDHLIAIAMACLLVLGMILLVLYWQNPITPRQKNRINKLKMAYSSTPSEQSKHKRTLKIKSPIEFLKHLIIDAGFGDDVSQILENIKIFIMATFVVSFLLSLMFGFSPQGSIITGFVAALISPLIPVGILYYIKTTRLQLIAEELFIVMTHIVDAVEAAGRSLQGAVEDSIYAAPLLGPYLQKFLNTYLMRGLDDATDELRKAVNMDEMQLFLDLLSHGFQHATTELTNYFMAESETYHELELAAKQRRMDRREILFDVLLVFPFGLGFVLMIYPVFQQGLDAISHAL